MDPWDDDRRRSREGQAPMHTRARPSGRRSKWSGGEGSLATQDDVGARPRPCLEDGSDLARRTRRQTSNPASRPKAMARCCVRDVESMVREPHAANGCLCTAIACVHQSVRRCLALEGVGVRVTGSIIAENASAPGLVHRFARIPRREETSTEPCRIRHSTSLAMLLSMLDERLGSDPLDGTRTQLRYHSSLNTSVSCGTVGFSMGRRSTWKRAPIRRDTMQALAGTTGLPLCEFQV